MYNTKGTFRTFLTILSMFFKKKVTRKFFAELVANMREKAEPLLIQGFNQSFDSQLSEKDLKYEITIFSTWLFMMSMLPPQDNELKDLYHDAIVKNLKQEERERLYNDIDKRYKNYNLGFSHWTKDSHNGNVLGTVIIEIIKNGNPNFDLKTYIPICGIDEAFEGFQFFIKGFGANLELLKDFKNKYKIA